MKTMNDYTLFCTEEQTKIVRKLGAPIFMWQHLNGIFSIIKSQIPTTQQMIGWLREKGLIVFVTYGDMYESHVYDKGCIMISSKRYFESFQEAELAAIDSALGYLEQHE